MADVAGGGEYRLHVVPEVLIEASQALHAVADELETGHRRLVGEVGDLLGHLWQGQASGAFRKDWQDFEKGSQGVIEDARAIAGLVDYAAQSYVQQEAANTSVVDTIRPGTL
jgi:WXG100 family type VII secretion target